MNELIKKGLLNFYINMRKITSSKRALPKFIILGTQKGGTSSLYNNLCKHPQIKKALKKEVHFFDYNYEKGIDWYKSFFDYQNNLLQLNAITGEASPLYLYLEEVPERIFKTLGSAIKLIILLRNPVDRTISHFEFYRLRGLEKRTQDEFLKEFNYSVEKMVNYERSLNNIDSRRDFSYITRSLYSEQIDAYKKYFQAENIKIILSERFFIDPTVVMEELNNFLNIRKFSYGLNPKIHYNKQKEISSKFRGLLINYFSSEIEKIENNHHLDLSTWRSLH